MILKNLTGDFFVEVGAFDGVNQSNTLEFERNFGWQGLLIEAGAHELAKLHKVHRNAWISHACLSLRNYPLEVMFHPAPNYVGRISGIIGEPDAIIPTPRNPNAFRADLTKKDRDVRTQCFPLFSFLAALNVTVLDFLSLDIEGDELKILRTIPFDKVLIKVVAVEILQSSEGQGPYREFMESKGFKTVGVFYFYNLPYDLIFVHNSVPVGDSVLELLKPK